MSSKATGGRSAGFGRSAAPGDEQSEGGGGPKPLSATLLQEFQNLKDKFKNEDESYERGKDGILLLFE
jgi:hypothetical protein